MYTFVFYYENGMTNLFEHIERVSFTDGPELTGQQILDYKYHLSTEYHLYSKDSSFTVGYRNLVYVEIHKED